MRKNVEYYNGYDITKYVLKRVNLIDSKRTKEEITQFAMEKINTLDELCEISELTPENIHIILGEDWYIIYVNLSDEEIGIEDWVAINKVKNKFAQTIEMFNALKKILLEYEQSKIYSMLRHSTSYPFYKKLLDNGYLEERYNNIELDDYLPKIEEIKQGILTKYDSIEEYLQDESREKYEGSHLGDYIYHNVSFSITDKFRRKYKKSGR